MEGNVKSKGGWSVNAKSIHRSLNDARKGGFKTGEFDEDANIICLQPERCSDATSPGSAWGKQNVSVAGGKDTADHPYSPDPKSQPGSAQKGKDIAAKSQPGSAQKGKDITAKSQPGSATRGRHEQKNIWGIVFDVNLRD